MQDFGPLLPIGYILVFVLIYLSRMDGSPAVRLWTAGFVFLYASGMVTAGETSELRIALATLFNAGFTSLMFAGACVFSGRAIPRWLFPGATLFGIARAGTVIAGHPLPLGLLAIAISLPLYVAAGLLVWRTARVHRSGFAESLLGPAFVGLGVMTCVAMAVHLTGMEPFPAKTIWIWASVSMLLLQALSAFERARSAEKERSLELDRERRTLRAILDASPEQILLCDDQGTVEIANDRAARSFGAPARSAEATEDTRELAQSAMDALMAQESLAGVRARIAADPDAVIDNLEFRTESPIGPEGGHSYRLDSLPVKAANGDALGRLWITRDMTLEKELQTQLIQSQKMETLGTLAGGIAHDFNNQLTTILGNARLARDEIPEGSELVEECLHDLVHAAEHCAELTQGLLAFARRAPSSARAVDVESAMKDLESLVRSTFPRSIRLEIDLAPGTWRPHADPTQLQQVLLNLAINARDAIDGRGRVRISVRNRIGDGARAGAPFVEFEVRDNGSGIDPQAVDRIFDPFFTTKPSGTGTGLGLAIVYGIVQSHGGWLEVESEPGDTAIRACFPKSDFVEGERDAGTDLGWSGGLERVLLVDDEPAVLRVARAQLTRQGYDVVTARSGEEAIEVFRDADPAPDVAVVDYSMPGIDGIETLRALSDLRPGLPAVLATGYFDGQARARLESHVTVLDKPYRGEQLGQAIRDVCDFGERRGAGGGAAKRAEDDAMIFQSFENALQSRIEGARAATTPFILRAESADSRRDLAND